MAVEGLFPNKDEVEPMKYDIHLKYPKLGAMLEYILSQQPNLLESSQMREQKLIFPSEIYVAMIKFLLKCFEADVEQSDLIERSPEFYSSVETMCLLLEHAMATDGSNELHATASKALLNIGSCLPKVIFQRTRLHLTHDGWLTECS